MALQHLRSSTANKRPNPTAMAAGQLALNTEATSPGLFFKDSAGNLVKVGPVHVGTTAPNATPAAGGTTGNSKGEIWLDTTGGAYDVKVWDGSAWRSQAGEFVNVSGDTMTGALVMDNQQQVRFRETTANGTNYIAIQAPASIATDKTLTLPDTTGTLVSTGDTGSVTSTMIADGTIVNADINTSAAIAHSKLANITAGSVLLGNASNVPTATALSGDVTVTSSGVTTVVSGSTSTAGKLQLTDSTSSTSTTTAATPNSVKSAYDLANAALPKAGGTISGNIDNTATGYFDLPVGTTAQRPGTANSGMIRFNSDLTQFEGYNGTAWSAVGGGATGGGSDRVFVETNQNVTANYTLSAGFNAVSAGPCTVASGVTVTIPSGASWVIV